MLVALTNETRTEAWCAPRGPRYICPQCRQDTVLRRGQLVAAHFAHKPPVACSWGRGETQAHLAAKRLLCDAMRARGLPAEVEREVASLHGDRRADVLVWGNDGTCVAFEIQHQPLDYSAIDRRTRAYMTVGVRVIWISLITSAQLAVAEWEPDGALIRKYSPRPWEKWSHAYGMGEHWFLEPTAGALWQGRLQEHKIEVPSTTWFTSGGVEHSGGGFSRSSKRWRDLRLHGPVAPQSVGIQPFQRLEWSGRAFSLPAGPAAKFMFPPASV